MTYLPLFLLICCYKKKHLLDYQGWYPNLSGMFHCAFLKESIAWSELFHLHRLHRLPEHFCWETCQKSFIPTFSLYLLRNWGPEKSNDFPKSHLGLSQCAIKLLCRNREEGSEVVTSKHSSVGLSACSFWLFTKDNFLKLFFLQ